MIRRYIVGGYHGVNHKFAPIAGGPDPFAPAPASRTGRAFGGGAPANSGHGPIAHLKSSRATETGRHRNRSTSWKKCLLRRKPPRTKHTPDACRGIDSDACAGTAGDVARSHRPQARSA